MKKCSYCGRESDDALTTCRECGSTLPQQSLEIKAPRIATDSELRVRKRALLQGIIRAIFSLSILAVGWLFPAWFLAQDPITRHETDTRLGPAFLFCLVVSFIFAVLAVRSFRLASSSESPARSQ